MWKIAALIIALSVPAFAADGFTTDDDFQDDFETARYCGKIDSRMVWAGETAYFIQAWLFGTGESKQLSEDSASAIPISDNTPETLEPFSSLCG
jgi:hypothetical protein